MAKSETNIAKKVKFPYETSVARLRGYSYYEKLFMGDHFNAFNIKINSKEYNKAYAQLRYVCANFAGLISKVIADMLFSEPIKIKVPDGDQEWMDAFVQENKLDVLFYENALSNSYSGDQLFKLRIKDGKKMFMSNCPPGIYFPEINIFDVDEDPEVKELAWAFKRENSVGKEQKYLRKEIHHPKKIVNEIYLMKGDTIEGKTTFKAAGLKNIKDSVITKIDKHLLVHIPNWKTTTRFWGISDYYDLTSIFYGINNRLTKVDNILDKHSDPLLIVPPGILDKKGQVKKGSLGVVEIKNAEDGKPEYVVWDASLENAFKEIDKLVDVFFMMSETSPDILGMGDGKVESGRALKLKLLRTVAKAARKRLYYNHAIKDILYRAQLLAKAWKVGVGEKNLKLKGEAVMPELEWADGLPQDLVEQIENENKRIDAGTTTTVDAIMRIDQVDEDTAKRKAAEIKKEKEVMMPQSTVADNPFNKVKQVKKKAEVKGAISKNGGTK